MKIILFVLITFTLASMALAAEPTPAEIQRAVAASIAVSQRTTQPQICPCNGQPGACVCNTFLCACGLEGSRCQLRPKVVPSYSLLIISEDNCIYCDHLLTELRSHGADLQWDCWKNSSTMEAKYGGVTAYPTILLLRDGKEINRRVGYATAAELRRWKDNPGPVSRGEAVEKDNLTRSAQNDALLNTLSRQVYQQPMMQPMRYASFCST